MHGSILETEVTKKQDNEWGVGARDIKSTLVSKNITILGSRTSIRLEPEMWQAIYDIARKEGCSIHELCTLVRLRKDDKTTLTAAIRVFLMLYYRAAATQEGHERAGHGDFATMKKRARVYGDLRTQAASLLQPNPQKSQAALEPGGEYYECSFELEEEHA
jgi:predicted DNA-binding ribbon-helix-helix protein